MILQDADAQFLKEKQKLFCFLSGCTFLITKAQNWNESIYLRQLNCYHSIEEPFKSSRLRHHQHIVEQIATTRFGRTKEEAYLSGWADNRVNVRFDVVKATNSISRYNLDQWRECLLRVLLRRSQILGASHAGTKASWNSKFRSFLDTPTCQKLNRKQGNSSELNQAFFFLVLLSRYI